MRHQKKTVKLGRTAEHRKAMLANQVCSLIEHGRIKTTLAKAKAVRPLAEKMVTLGKKGTLHHRRTAIAYLHQVDLVKKLFDEVAPRTAARAGGYTRIVKLGQRQSDSAPMAFIEWVDSAVSTDGEATAATPATTTAAAPEAKAEATPRQPKSEEAKANGKTRATGSRRVAEKAKRAETKARKQKALETATPKLKAKGKPARSRKK